MVGKPATPALVSSVHSREARPFATIGMNALPLHHVIRAVTAIRNPPMVRALYFGEKSSEIFARCSLPTFFHRSGSLINKRTKNATAAGASPNRNTYRHEVAGSVKKTPVT